MSFTGESREKVEAVKHKEMPVFDEILSKPFNMAANPSFTDLLAKHGVL